jgi:hypothetical protein
MQESEQYWFPARPPEYGWGWGFPIAWQGWLVLALFFVLLIGGIFVLALNGYPFAISLWAVALGAGLIGVCAWKGEPPGPFLHRDRGR